MAHIAISPSAPPVSEVSVLEWPQWLAERVSADLALHVFGPAAHRQNCGPCLDDVGLDRHCARSVNNGTSLFLGPCGSLFIF